MDETSFPFKSGDKVLLKGTNFAGEVTIAKETESKVLFDDENAPDYWYYPNDQLEKLPVEEKK